MHQFLEGYWCTWIPEGIVSGCSRQCEDFLCQLLDSAVDADSNHICGKSFSFAVVQADDFLLWLKLVDHLRELYRVLGPGHNNVCGLERVVRVGGFDAVFHQSQCDERFGASGGCSS